MRRSASPARCCDPTRSCARTSRSPAAIRRAPPTQEIEALVAIPLYLRDRFHGVIVCANRPDGFDAMDDDVLLALGDHAGAALHHGQLHNELNEAHRAAVRALLEAMAARDLGLHQESTALTLHALALARDLELEPGQRDVLVCATLLRHVGYAAVPDRILRAERPLRPDERAVIELHSRVAFNIIGQVPALRDVAAAILYHHERYDGRGHPAPDGRHDPGHRPRAGGARGLCRHDERSPVS